jgi:uncharacterized phosphatase
VLDLPVLEPLPLLTERDCGAAEGLPVDEAAARWPDADYPDGESIDDLSRRAAAAWERIHTSGVEDLVVVGHGLHLRAMGTAAAGEDVGRLANGAVLFLTADGPAV